MRKNKSLKIVFIALITLLLVVLSFILFISISKQKIMTVISPSMEPTIKIYDGVIIKTNISIEELKKDDIISFHSQYLDQNYLITHRIVDIYNENGEIRFITKGDNNILPDDGYITFSNIEGKVVKILPKIGKISLFLTSKYGWIFLILIPCLLFLIIYVFRLTKIVVKNLTKTS